MTTKKLIVLSLVLGISALSMTYAQVEILSWNTQQSSWEENIATDEFNLDDLGDLDADLNSMETTDASGSTDSALQWWGFKDTDSVVVKENGTDYVILSAPAVTDNNGEVIKRYKVTYSTTSMTESSDNMVALPEFTFEEITGDVVDLQITWLIQWTNYYVVVVPVNKDNVEWNASTELSFTLESHEAAPVSLQNTSYAVESGSVNVKWSAIEWASKVEVYVKEESEADYKKIGTANMTDGTYGFPVAKSWNYSVKMIPTDDNWNPVGSETLLTVKVENVADVAVNKAPKVWPATDLMIATLIIASILYFALRFRRIDK